MRKLCLLIYALLLAGCSSNNHLTFTEVTTAEVNSNVQDFILQMKIHEEGIGNGIYLFRENKNPYVFLSQEFLTKGSEFGKFDVKSENQILNIYLNEDTATAYDNNSEEKLFRVDLDREYKEIHVLKNGVETHIQNFGI